MQVADLRMFAASVDNQGCQMVCFQTKNHNFGQIRRASEWKMLWYFMNILRPFGVIYGLLVYIVCGPLLYFFTFWYVWTKKNLATLLITGLIIWEP
jgi:hypothetical protein